jgi:flagellar basal-body rod protein FlgB
MLSKIDNDLAFIQTALDLRARRQEILASNIANADTPNYKARDLDFPSALQNAMGVVGGSLQLTRTSARHLDAVGTSAGLSAGLIKYRAVLQPSLDGNTVDSDVEKGQFADNAMHYQFLLDRASSVFKTMALAVSPN